MNGSPWLPHDIEALKRLYPNHSTKDVARILGRSLSSIYATAKKLGIKKSAEFLASEESGRLKKGQCRPGMVATQFKKGQTPANKGLRRPGWAPGRMKETQFKPGHRGGAAALNHKPVGTIKTDPDGYLRIKVREAVHGKEATGFGNTKVWPLYGRYVWEQHNGPIPPKHIVTFKDGNRLNCAIENLELMSCADNARRNSMWAKMPRELAEVIQLRGALNRKLRRLSGEKQA
jgi:hypothetical protein